MEEALDLSSDRILNNNKPGLITTKHLTVTHSWVEKSIELVRVKSKIIRFCEILLEKWNKTLHLKTKQEVLRAGMKRKILNIQGVPRGNVPDFDRMFLTSKYTDLTQNTCIRS